MTSNQTSESSGTQLKPPRRCCASCLLLAVVLVSGLLAGLGLTVIFDLDDKVTEMLGIPPKPRKIRSIAELRDRLTDRYAAELDLSDESKSNIRKIITEHLSSSLERRIQLLDKLSKCLDPVLNDAQKAQWEKAKADRIKKWSEGMPTTRPTA